MNGGPKIGLLHDWLFALGGAERVFDALCDLFPDAGLYAGAGAAFWRDRAVSVANRRLRAPTNSTASRLGPAIALRSRMIRDLDLLIADGHSASLWAKVAPETPVLYYCHTPSRYIWRPDLLNSSASLVHPLLRALDKKCAKRPQVFLANSETTKARIMTCYGREAEVVYPPVDTEFFRPGERAPSSDVVLIVSRLEPHRVPVAFIELVATSGAAVRVIGVGSSFRSLVMHFQSDHRVSFLGRPTDEVLRHEYRNASALIVPGEQDFGMVAAEAAACGTPVIAERTGGSSEIVIDGLNGVLVGGRNPSDWLDALRAVRGRAWIPHDIRKSVARFSVESFETAIRRHSQILLDGDCA